MKRRAFLKTTCKLCALGAAGLALPQVLSSCGSVRSLSISLPIENGRVAVPLNLFENESLQLVRPKGWMYSIAVFKTENGFQALLMKCTHMDNQLYPSSEGFRCSMHGSEFSKEGVVKKGPAEKKLQHFVVEKTESDAVVYL